MLTCALASPAQARSWIAYLPVKVAFENSFSMFGCSNLVQCVSNPNELDDGDIGAGVYSKNASQLLSYEHFKMADVGAVNWASATAVTQVALVGGIQASGNACTQVSVGAFNEDFPNEIFTTAKELCQTSSNGAQSFMFPLETPAGVLGWTVPMLRRTEFETYLNRHQSGARQYLAALRIRVMYEAP